jgi:hypothetical protein
MDQGNDRLLLLLSAFAVCLNGNHSGKVDALVYCANQEDIPLLRQVNKDIENYLLLYSNSLTSKGYDGRSKLRYQDCSGARGFIEIQDGKYVGEPEDHLLNRIDMTGRFFGICKDKDLDRLFQSHVAEGTYKVNASRQSGRFQVIKL